MKLPTYLGFIALIGALAFLALFIADREIRTGVERLSGYKFSPDSGLDTPRPGRPSGPRTPTIQFGSM